MRKILPVFFLILVLCGTASAAAVPTYSTQIGDTGTYSAEDGYFNSPCGVAVSSSGEIYVADRNNERIQVFDKNGVFLRKWGSAGTGDGQFHGNNGCEDIAFDANGDVWVIDYENHRIQKFSASGEFLWTFGSEAFAEGYFEFPRGIAIHPDNGKIYVADCGNYRIQVFDSDGTFKYTFGSKGTGPGRFANGGCVDIDFDADGYVWVADRNNHRIQKFTARGMYCMKLGSPGSDDGQFACPEGVAVHPVSGDIYVVDRDNHRIQVFGSNGTFKWKFGSEGTAPGQFRYPVACAFDEDGNLWVVDRNNHRVQKFIVPLPPVVTTSAAASIAATSATLGGNVTAEGAAAVTERGIVYSSTDTSPTIGEAGVIKDANGAGTGAFAESIGALTPGTYYYYNAYAINDIGTNYGTASRFTTSAPEMQAGGNNIIIYDGDTTPRTADYTDFGAVAASTGSISRTFTISNNGSAPLSLTGSPLVSVTGPQSGDFSVTTQPATPVAAHTHTTFTVTFDPCARGIRAAQISIANDDADENPYDFSIQGTGANSCPDLSLSDSTMVYAAGDPAASIDADATVSDTDGDADWDGGSLRAQITANAEPDDHISIIDSDGDGTTITISGTDILAGGTDIGDLSASDGTVSGDTALTITFDADATNASVREVLQSLRYHNTAHFPGTADRAVTITATDQNAGSTADTRTISVSPPPTVSFTTATQTSTSESGILTVTAQLSRINGRDVTIPFSIDGSSTATGAATDYAVSASPLTIPAGNTSASITITIVEDVIDEPGETVVINMGTPVSATRGAITSHTATINDDDAAPDVSFTSVSQTSTNESGTMTVTAQLSEISGRDVTIPFSIDGSSTGAGKDYAVSASPLTIPAGNTSASITITIADDVIDEPDEMVVINMGTPVNAARGAITTHTATIMDDDAAPDVSFTSASQASASESGTMTVTAQLSRISSLNVTMPFSIDGSSTGTGAGTDYAVFPSPLTIPAGDTSASITITIIDDAIDEPDETVVINMGTPVNATRGAITTHTATITDDDAVGFTVTESGGDTTVSESETADTFTVVLDARPSTDVVLGVNSADTTEATVSPATLTFTSTDWDTPQTVTVTGVADNLDDGTQTTAVTIAVDDDQSDEAFAPLSARTVNVRTTEQVIKLIPPRATTADHPRGAVNTTAYAVTVGGIGVEAYKYSLDDGPWSTEKPVDEPLTFDLDAEGSHSLRIRGRNVSDTWQSEDDATRIAWRIDRTPPTAALLFNIPRGTVSTTTARIIIGGHDVAAYLHALDGDDFGPPRPVTRPLLLEDLADGDHTLAVLAADEAGNWQDEADAATTAWTVDTSVPTAVLTNIPALVTARSAASITVSGADGTHIDAYTWSLDGGPWSPRAAGEPIDLHDLAEGAHTLSVKASRGAVSQETATTCTWTVDMTPPAAPVLTVSAGAPAATTALLSWDAVAEARRYRVRLSDDPITADNWDRTTEIYCGVTPRSDGETFEVTGLAPGRKNHFAVTAVDAAGNESAPAASVAFTTASTLPEITDISLEDDGMSGDNSRARQLRITGANFLEAAGANMVRLENSATAFQMPAQTGTTTTVRADIPAGAPAGIYNVRVVNKNGVSAAAPLACTIRPAPTPLPEVLSAAPLMAATGTTTSIAVSGRNFAAGAAVNLLAADGSLTPLDNVTCTAPGHITAALTPAADEGHYMIQVVNTDGTKNEISAARLEICRPLTLADTSGAIRTTRMIESDAGLIPSATTLTTDDRDEVGTTTEHQTRISVTFPAGTILEKQDPTLGWQEYAGAINPPRQIPLSAAVERSLGTDSVLFTLGAEDSLRLKDGGLLFAEVEVVLPDYAPAPTIFHAAPDGALTPAGVDGTHKGLNLKRGGTVLSTRSDCPEQGRVTYTMGLLLDHMSTYAAGAEQQDPGPTGDTGGAGGCFINQAQ